MLNQLQFKCFILLLASVALLTGCESDPLNEKDSLNEKSINSALLKANEDYSSTNLENFVLENESFEIFINDSTKLKFKNINYPKIYDPEADVVYSTEDEKGHITFDNNGGMFFIYNTDKGETYRGAFHKSSSEAIQHRGDVRHRMEKAKTSRTFVLLNPEPSFKKAKNHLEPSFKLMSTVQKNNVIEYLPLPNKEMRSKFNISTLNDNKNSCCGVEENSPHKSLTTTPYLSNKEHARASGYPIKIFVYTLNKELSSADINYAKINTRNSLKRAYYGSNSEFSSKVWTYFNASKYGRKIVQINGARDRRDLLYKWKDFIEKSGTYQSNYKYLLLADIRYGGLVTEFAGSALIPGDFAWANVSRHDHLVPGHEVAHMFGATHTKPYWKRYYFWGWWECDIMYFGTWWYLISHYVGHRDKGNISSINYYINHPYK